jgi:hypothetical protein
MDFDEEQPSYPPEVETAVQSLRGDCVLGYDNRADNEIEAVFNVIKRNIASLTDRDRSVALRALRGYVKQDVKGNGLKSEIEEFLSSQLRADLSL